MSMPERRELTERLTSEIGYPPAGAELVADKIEGLHPELRQAFARWWGTGEWPDVEIEGYTVERLVEERGLNPLAALLTLDWLRREPEAARTTIEHGHDRIATE